MRSHSTTGVALVLVALAPSCSRSTKEPPPEPSMLPTAVESEAPPPAPSASVVSKLRVEDVKIAKKKFLARMRPWLPSAVAACRAGADAGNDDLPFPADLAKALAKESDVVEARINCWPGPSPSFATLHGLEKAEHSGENGIGGALDDEDGLSLEVDRPSPFDEAPDAVAIELEQKNVTTLTVSFRSRDFPSYVPDGDRGARMKEVAELRDRWSPPLDALFSALASDCDAQVHKLTPALADRFRKDADLLDLRVACYTGNAGPSYTLYENPAAKRAEGVMGEADGVHAKDGTLYQLKVPSPAVKDAVQLEVTRRTKVGSTVVTLQLRTPKS